jgi:poly-gamma-glutamate synthesis protein (capsule biosynthesis protein)
VVYFERQGVRFALINYTYGTNGLVPTKGIVVNSIDEERIKQDISNINRDGVDCLIACMHWGMEYQRRANDEQRTLAKMLKQEGVDVIIGSHPHVVQGYEADSTGVVFYSLGNLVSNQRKRYCNGGLLAEIKVIRCDTVDNLQYMATAHPVYVSMPGYRLLPKSVGDTMRLSQSSRYSYDRFMSDTESLLSTEFK